MKILLLTFIFFIFSIFTNCNNSTDPNQENKNYILMIGGDLGDKTVGNRFTNEIWQSKDGVSWQILNSGGSCSDARKLSVSACDSPSTWTFLYEKYFGPRRGHQVVNFKNKLYLFGGEGVKSINENSFLLNDIWESSDGKNWEIVNAGGTCSNTDLKTRFQCEVAGLTWRENDKSLYFASRKGHQAIAFKNNIYIIGGELESQTFTNDIWAGTNVKTLSKVTIQLSTITNTIELFSPRRDHATIVFNNKIFLIGGRDNINLFGDVWSSENGEKWTNILQGGSCSDDTIKSKISCIKASQIWTDDIEKIFSPRSGHQLVNYKSTLFLIGGRTNHTGLINDSATINEVWSTKDGEKWFLVNSGGTCSESIYKTYAQCIKNLGKFTDDRLIFNSREKFSVITNNDLMVLVGGINDNNVSTNDVLSSSEGSGWKIINAGGVCDGYPNSTKVYCNDAKKWLPFSNYFAPRSSHVLVNFKLP